MTTKKAKTASAKTTKSAKAKPAAKAKKAKSTNGDGKKTSAIDAAWMVLTEAREPMNTKQLIELMASKRLWTSPGGKTPAQTLYASILREITTKGSESRFKKTDRGLFAAKA